MYISGATVSSRFDLPTARDLDVGVNSVRSYRLGQNDHFDIEVRDSEYGDKSPFLLLQKPLDRESQEKHVLTFTAIDGGNPPKSGTLNITVSVLDVNDNRPVCNRDTYTIYLKENASPGFTVTFVNATDPDEGVNGEVEYTYGRNVQRKVFELDQDTGEIRVKGKVDFEDAEVYKLSIQASDKGHPPMSANCRVVIKIIDVNDNQPEIEITSLYKNIPEDSKPGTVIFLVSMTDKDAGINGKVICQLNKNIPFDERVYSGSERQRSSDLISSQR
uniref:Cadherin domain-containing protein n=1 Tax=Sinocyclocheilus rhinocerous TaxID=307959 RepID=A0A673GBS3_9TELE